MKILQVIPFFSPKYGGTVNSTYILSKGLSKAGHDVTILTTNIDYDEEYIETIEKEGVKVVYLPFLINLGLLIYSPSMKQWLNDNLKNFDIIHMHNFRSYQNNIVRIYAKKYNIPYILQARGSVLPFFQKQKLKKIYDLVWGNNILNDAKAVIALTKDEQRQYQIMGVELDRIRIIPNGIDLSTSKNVTKGNFRLKYGILKEEKIILYLGRIDKIKGLDLLLEAFSKLLPCLSDVKLVIAGPPNDYQTSLIHRAKELMIEKYVLFTGPLYNTDKFEAYYDADVYVLPSSYDAFPNTVLEALMYETPVIVTKGCSINHIINKNAGFVVEYNSNELKSALFKLLSDTNLRTSFADKGKKIINRHFELSDIINQFIKLYNSIINIEEA